MAGMTVFITLPGLYREPIYIPITATIAQLTREIFNRTGVSLFNGFGFVGLDASGNQTARYLVPIAARVDNLAVVNQYDPAVAPVQTSPSGWSVLPAYQSNISLTNAVEDASAGTEATLVALGITNNMELKCFTTPPIQTPTTQSLTSGSNSQLDANT